MEKSIRHVLASVVNDIMLVTERIRSTNNAVINIRIFTIVNEDLSSVISLRPTVKGFIFPSAPLVDS